MGSVVVVAAATQNKAAPKPASNVTERVLTIALDDTLSLVATLPSTYPLSARPLCQIASADDDATKRKNKKNSATAAAASAAEEARVLKLKRVLADVFSAERVGEPVSRTTEVIESIVDSCHEIRNVSTV